MMRGLSPRKNEGKKEEWGVEEEEEEEEEKENDKEERSQRGKQRKMKEDVGSRRTDGAEAEMGRRMSDLSRMRVEGRQTHETPEGIVLSDVSDGEHLKAAIRENDKKWEKEARGAKKEERSRKGQSVGDELVSDLGCVRMARRDLKADGDILEDCKCKQQKSRRKEKTKIKSMEIYEEISSGERTGKNYTFSRVLALSSESFTYRTRQASRALAIIAF